MTSILDKIFEMKRARVEEAKQRTDVRELARLASERRSSTTPRRFRSALQAPDKLNVIAEFKKASPSRGVIMGAADPATIATMYESAGAAAVSVLTEEDHFCGSLDDLRAVRAAVTLPILRKDFTFDEFQIYEAAAAGADAVLLLANYLDAERMRDLRSLAEDELGLDALVEVHTVDEMRVAADIGATLIGANNRNLKTFDVSLDVSRRLIKTAPPDATMVAESGLKSHDDLVELRTLGYSGFLIGETLMRNEDAGAALRGLVGYSAR